MRKLETMVSRNKDILSGKEDLEELAVIRNFPIYCGVTLQSSSDDIFADMRFSISVSSGMIQLTQLVPEDILYSKPHNASIGKIWREHHTVFADFLQKYGHVKTGILEIGGGGGILNAIYGKRHGHIPWAIVEPASTCAYDECTALYFKAFYNETFIENLKSAGAVFDTLVHSHLMEHQYDIHTFMQLNCSVLPNGGRMIFSVPCLEDWIKRGYGNAMGFEHTYLLTESYISILLEIYGFRLIEKIYFGDQHSVFYAVEKQGKRTVRSQMIYRTDLVQHNKTLFASYLQQYSRLVAAANERIKKYHRDKIYLFGAHIFAQYLIAYGLDCEKIECILDNDPKKQGKRLYGTSFFVRSPKILIEEKSPAVICLMGSYSQEISDDIIRYINSEAEVWTEQVLLCQMLSGESMRK